MADEPQPEYTTEAPPELGEPVPELLSPMGEVESYGRFARGLGARRVKLAIFLVGGVLFVVALIQALTG